MKRTENPKKYSFSTPESYGDVFLSPLMVYAKYFIMRSLSRKRRAEGYTEISSPMIMTSDVWEKTGHWSYYKENMFVFSKHAFKPMSCPGALIYVRENFPPSFNSFPISIFEWGTVFRREKSGTLSSLRRLNVFTQDDSHIFCISLDQVYSAVKTCLASFIMFFRNILGWSFKVAISTRPSKSVNDHDAWQRATVLLHQIMQELEIEYFVDDGEGAFYGPKIDFIFDTQGNKNKKQGTQLGTIQLDFFLCKNLNLSFSGIHPYVIHFAMLGSLERFLSVLLEKNNNQLPFWCVETPYVLVNLLSNNKVPKLANKLRHILSPNWNFELLGRGDINLLLKQYKDSSVVFIGEKEEVDNSVSIREQGRTTKLPQSVLLSSLAQKTRDIMCFFC